MTFINYLFSILLNRVVLTLFLLVLFFILASCGRQLPEKPNIIIITTDYQAWEDIPELTPELKMPSVDRLYREGVVFRNHYCTAPVCMPSRYTMVSGTYPHTHKMWDNGAHWLPEGSPVLMEELNNAGYKTIGIGKMHFKPWDRMAGFDERIIADCQGNWAGDTLKKDDYYHYLKRAGKTRFDYLSYQDSTDLYGVYEWPMADTLDIDYYVGEQTVRYIENDSMGDDPWFLWVSFNGPHNPWDPPADLMNYYLEKELPQARYMEGELETKPYAHTITRYNYTRKVVDLIDRNPGKREEYIHRIRAGHYGGLTLIDQQIGRIFSKLEEKGKLDNAIIIFTSDHGAHLGDHDLIHKGTHYERSSHVPFVIWWPDALKPGEINGFTSHIDLFPTLVELAGGSLPEGLEGQSYYDVLTGKENAPDTAIIEIIGNTALVTKDYKYGMYRQLREADLYDRKADPDEFMNIVDDPGYSHLVKQFTEYLYRIDSTLKDDFENAPPVRPFPSKITLEHGQMLNRFDCPYLGGKSFSVKAGIDANAVANGPVIVHYEGPHGFSLFAEDGMLKAGFRKWNEDEIVILGRLKTGQNSIFFRLEKDGKISGTINNREYLAESSWPKPVQAGRKGYLTGIFCAGYSGPGWVNPVGNYNKGSEFTGHINFIELEVTDDEN
ncbi:MAG: sulfatase-like hydrolase/transferase [Bacteroidales bacterium]|nr:sulfatase-like hydrolase/transferase [Bacteroidales bacterium]